MKFILTSNQMQIKTKKKALRNDPNLGKAIVTLTLSYVIVGIKLGAIYMEETCNIKILHYASGRVRRWL